MARSIEPLSLSARAAKGPPEPALDAYVAECTDIVDDLDAARRRIAV
ncbi:hypothetical protein [Polyangium sp. 15x6]|nr:hypothetical protein [Polyangium sp. 15x6]MDI3288550.1 hypothetical protein [Polyangium sp. 15x6]